MNANENQEINAMNTHEMDETALSPEESLQMKEHLAECHRCYCLYQNLKGSLTCIKQAPEKKPAPGFSVRWQQQMILRTKEKEKTDLIHRILKVSALISVLSISSCLVFFLPGNLIKTALYISDLLKFISVQIHQLGTILSVFKIPLLFIGIGSILLLFIYIIVATLSTLTIKRIRKGADSHE
jgi:hypothetical protein